MMSALVLEKPTLSKSKPPRRPEREKHDERVGVGETDLEQVEAAEEAGALLLLGARHLELRVRAVGEVAAGEDEERGHQVQDEGHHDAEAPRGVDRLARRLVLVRLVHAEEAVHDEGHEQEGDAAADVAPPAGGRVDGADNAALEELRAPHLARDERREGEADDEATEDEGPAALRG